MFGRIFLGNVSTRQISRVGTAGNVVSLRYLAPAPVQEQLCNLEKSDHATHADLIFKMRLMSKLMSPP